MRNSYIIQKNLNPNNKSSHVYCEKKPVAICYNFDILLHDIFPGSVSQKHKTLKKCKGTLTFDSR